MNYSCIKNVILSFVMSALSICAIVLTVTNDGYEVWIKVFFSVTVGFYALIHMITFVVNLREYIATSGENDLDFRRNGWIVSCGSKSYELTGFEGSYIVCRGFFRGDYQVKKPLNYMGRCAVMLVDRHPVTGEIISFTRRNVVYYIDEDGEHHIVSGAEKDIDTLNLGKIRAEYEVYVNEEDYREAYPTG